ncbi:hypothetical protein LINGRAHAP2_LOCUS20172 [Linum grandiflorum]
MNMKKISCAVIFAAASISVVLAAEEAALLTPSASPSTAAGAPMAAAGGPAVAGGPAGGPTSDASSVLPAFGTLVGASFVSLFGYYFQ